MGVGRREVVFDAWCDCCGKRFPNASFCGGRTDPKVTLTKIYVWVKSKVMGDVSLQDKWICEKCWNELQRLAVHRKKEEDGS